MGQGIHVRHHRRLHSSARPHTRLHARRKGSHMRVGRTMGLLTLFAGLTAWFATRAAVRRDDVRKRSQTEDMTRWENDGGATTAGPQPPGATF
jgi:hypothetical protein